MVVVGLGRITDDQASLKLHFQKPLEELNRIHHTVVHLFPTLPSTTVRIIVQYLLDGALQREIVGLGSAASTYNMVPFPNVSKQTMATRSAYGVNGDASISFFPCTAIPAVARKLQTSRFVCLRAQ